MPGRRNKRREDDGGLPLPPVGLNYRRTRRRTNISHRATAAVTVADARYANLLLAQASSWLSLFMNGIMMTAQYLVVMMHTQANDDNISNSKARLDGYLQNAVSSFALASHAQQMTASIFLEVRRVIFYALEDLHIDSILSKKRKRYRHVAELEDTSSDFLTGFRVHELELMLTHLRFPDTFIPSNRRCQYGREEVLICFLAWLRKGLTFIELSSFVFGGDSRDFSHMMRCAVKHIYSMFYHKISGGSLSYWIRHIDQFRLAIYNRLTSMPRYWKSMVHPEIYGPMDLSFEFFRVFGFMDNVAFLTCQPGDWSRRRENFRHDIQEAFWSGYFQEHGLKAQAVFFPNGMFGSILVTSIAQNDVGVLNMSGLDEHLQDILHNKMIGINFPALYVDGIFNPRHTIVPRFKGRLSANKEKFNKRLSGVRVSIEHAFGLHKSLFGLFTKKRQLQLFNNREHLHNLVVVSFLVQNLYQIFNHSLSYFDLAPPTLDEYLPLDEVIPPAPFVSDADLGQVYDFSIRNEG